MTPEEARALGERVVACPGWRWMPGMLGLDQHDSLWRAYRAPVGLAAQGEPRGFTASWSDSAELFGAVPDLLDPATVGAILFGVVAPLGWVLTTYADGSVSMSRVVDGTFVGTMARQPSIAHAVAEALRRTPPEALEAAADNNEGSG